MIVYDRATRWKGCYAVPSRSGDHAYQSLNHFVGPKDECKSIWTDGSTELKFAIKRLGWNGSKSTPGISQTNSVAERQVRDILNGTRALLVHAGLPAAFWCYAAPAYCFGTNTKSSDGLPSAYSLRFPDEGEFTFDFIPFGAAVWFMRTPTLVQADKPPKFAPTGVRGVLLGYRLQPGCRWKHEFEVAELTEFEDLDFAYNASPKQVRNIRVHTVQEVRLPEVGYLFPLQERYRWRNNTLEGIQHGKLITPRPMGNVEALQVHNNADNLDEVEEEVATNNLLARARRTNVWADGDDADLGTPDTVLVTPPLGEAVEPLEAPAQTEPPRTLSDFPPPLGGYEVPAPQPKDDHMADASGA